MMASDMAAVLRVQAVCYPPHLHESGEVLLDKLERNPQSCWVVERNRMVIAYLFAHPWMGEMPPAFDAPLVICKGSPYFYLHDMAIHPDCRGEGLGRILWQWVQEAACSQACEEIRLIAVMGAQLFWARLGFTCVTDVGSALAGKLGEYGDEARLMRYVF